jgi:hypothetical protein
MASFDEPDPLRQRIHGFLVVIVLAAGLRALLNFDPPGRPVVLAVGMVLILDALLFRARVFGGSWTRREFAARLWPVRRG